ncbi:hypothetical protein [Natronorubrum daqingense]|uniref:Phospholipase_D-nuclease N-terminal n=1 Tax=Natronorubrum daqingense TaxID=588898 RepID=A0A1N6Z2J5_9EURY|nr:hypothetical protein [Natronorubrum daqingense]SIR20999.1 hypothetical protein SAMN05421809_0651 [Natronorubrum daqingense]
MVVVGLPELIMATLLIVFISVLAGKWVYDDAKSRQSGWAWQWGVGIAFLFLAGIFPGIVGLLIYVITRGERVD